MSNIRYTLVIPEELFQEIETIAKKEGKKRIEIIRQFIKLGLLIDKTMEDPNSSLILKNGDDERDLLII